MKKRNKLHSKFGGKLQELREKRGLTQDEFASEMNVSLDSVKNWEQGYNYPRTEQLIQIANYFKCSYDYLLGDQKGPNKRFSHISKMTGLTYPAVENIQKIKKEYPNLLPIISGILENTALLQNIGSAVFAEYKNEDIQRSEKLPVHITAETLYTAETTKVFESFMEYVNTLHKEWLKNNDKR